jgi:hypothetical protein
MASIKRPVLLAPRLDENRDWIFTVEYTAVFELTEVGANASDRIALFERDITSADDRLTDGFVNRQDFFVGQPFGGEIPRSKLLKMKDRDISTELGGEEIYAIVELVSERSGARVTARTNEQEVRT